MGYKQRRGHRCHVLAAHPVLIQFSSPLRPHPGISDTASPRRCVKLSNLPEIISRTLQTLGSPKRITGRGSLVNIPQPPTASFPPTAINPLIPPSSPHSTTMSSIYGVRFLILIFFSFPFTNRSFDASRNISSPQVRPLNSKLRPPKLVSQTASIP